MSGNSDELQNLPRGGYTVFDHFDDEYDNPREFGFPNEVVVGDEFDHDMITYRVTAIRRLGAEPAVILKTIRQQIEATNTQVVHKCPARKRRIEDMSRDDVLKFQAEYGARKTNALMSPRIRLGVVEFSVCHDCGCEFWKLESNPPEAIHFERTLD